MPHAARRRLPTHMLHLAGLHPATLVISFGGVVVIACLGSPRRVDLRVERPIRQIDAAHGTGERAAFECVRRKPELAVPRADPVARTRFADRERQHALWTKSRLGFFVGYELR